MAAIIKSNIRDQVYDILRTRILDNTYDFGEELNVVHLTKDLGVSNTPIREALSMLSAEGLVTSEPGGRYHVVSLTPELIQEVNTCMQILLKGAYMYAKQEGKLTELSERLSEVYDAQCEAYLKRKQAEDLAYITKAIAFDKVFIEIANNQRLSDFMTLQSDILTLCVRYAYEHNQLGAEDNLKEHEEILKAIKSGDDDHILALLGDHFDKSW